MDDQNSSKENPEQPDHNSFLGEEGRLNTLEHCLRWIAKEIVMFIAKHPKHPLNEVIKEWEIEINAALFQCPDGCHGDEHIDQERGKTAYETRRRNIEAKFRLDNDNLK